MGLLEEVEAQVRENARIEAERSLERFENDFRRKAYPWDFVGSERVLSESYKEGFIKAKQGAAIERLKEGLVNLGWERFAISPACDVSGVANSQSPIEGYQPVRSSWASNSDPIPPGDE